MNIIEVVKSNLDKLTKSEYVVATHFIKNPNDFAFETLDSVAVKINTSTTSVLRFCRKNGFSGYKAFQDEVRGSFKYQLTLPDKLKIASENADDMSFSKPAYNAISCIEKTFNSISPDHMSYAVDEILNANRLFCFGLKESFALAHYAYTRFLTIRSDVFMLTSGHSGEIESLLSLKKDDVCMFYLFHRYTKQSPKILEQIKKQGTKVVLITNPPYDELEKYASIVLPCFVDINGIKNSAAAPVCLTDCLCNMAVSRSNTEILDYMKKSESLFMNFTL